MGGAAIAERGGIFYRRPAHHRLAKRRRRRGRLHERSFVSRHRRAHRLLRLRRLHVLGRLARRLSHRPARRRRAAAQFRQIHHGRRARLPAEPAARPRHGGAEHDHGQHLLHDRADGRRGRARHPVVRQLRQLSHRGHWRRRAHDHLRRLRRHAGHHLGADHQGHPPHGRHHSAQHPRHGAFRLELREFLRGRDPCHLSRQGRGR